MSAAESVEVLRRGPQGLRDGVDPTAAASGGQPFGVVGGQCKTAFGEEDLQPSGQRSHGAAGQASPLQQGSGMVGMFVVQQPSQLADQATRPSRRVTGGQVADELAEPGRRVGQPGDEVLAGDEGPFRAALPAGRAQAVAGMRAQLTAVVADARRVLRLART